MPKMIILISDQRMQNLIPMLQKGSNYSQAILVLSKDRRTDKSLQRFLDSANDLKCVLGSKVETDISDKLVDPYDIKQVAETIGTLLKEVGTDTVINISGGTKPMAIGALQAAQSAGIDCVYTNMEDMELIWLSPDGSTQHEPIQVEGLDIPLYIRAYGEEVTTSQEVSNFSADQKAWAATIVEQHKHIYQKVIKPVTDAIKGARGNYPADCLLAQPVTRRRCEIIAQLAAQGLWQWDEQSLRITIPDKVRAAFLNGGWVELCVAHLLEQSGFKQVLLNVKLKGVEGEIDVIAIHNGKLLLVECKSNTQLSVQLNKLDGFRRRLGGPFAQAYYARASGDYKKQVERQCQKIKLDKAFLGPELQHIGREISSRIGVSHPA